MKRKPFIIEISQAFKIHPVVAILGPRQCGKTTLAKMYKEHFKNKGVFTYFDLEDPRHLARLESPILALEEILRFHQTPIDQAYYWGIHNKTELDLFLIINGKKLGFEIKYTDYPKVTKSMNLALEILKLDQLTVIVPGQKNYSLAPKIRVQGLESYLEL